MVSALPSPFMSTGLPCAGNEMKEAGSITENPPIQQLDTVRESSHRIFIQQGNIGVAVVVFICNFDA